MQPKLQKFTRALVKKKLLTEKQLDKIRRMHKKTQGSLLQTLGGTDFVKQEALLERAACDLEVPVIHTSKCHVPPEIASLVPQKIAKAHHVLPVSRINDMLTVAMSDPFNINAIDDLKRATGMKITPVMASQEELLESIDHAYNGNASEKLEGVIEEMEVKEMTIVESGETESKDVSELLNLTQEEPVVKITDQILLEGIKRKASDIFVEPQANDLLIRYRVDGVLQEGMRPPRTMYQGIVSRIKIISNLDIAEHRLPQDGRCKIEVGRRMIDFRVSTVPSYYGEKICMRILDAGHFDLDIKKLGFDKKSTDDLLEAANCPFGLILTCGPTGSGKTTTLYAILSHLNGIKRNLVTIEDPVEYAVYGINQVHTRAEVGLTFDVALRSILRQDPDVIMVGEMRDSETADIAVKSALTGHLVLSTLHTNTAVGSVVRLVNMKVEPFLLSSSLILIAAQRLLRKLCVKCRLTHKVTPEMKKSLQLKSDVAEIFRPKGCPKCSQTGYAGRTCVMETLKITHEIRNMIGDRASEEKLKKKALEHGMVTLRQNALRIMKEGITSAEEVLRVTARDEES